MTSPRIALAVNPTSGKGRGARAGAAVTRRFGDGGADVVVLAAGSAEELTMHCQDAVSSGVDALVVVGGDGMVHLGANIVAGTDVPLGIVPAGTGNDVARGVGLPVGDWETAARVVLRGLSDSGAATRRIDGVRVTAAWGTRWFVGVLGAGFDAVVNERANSWRRPRGHLRYDLAMLRELPVFTPRTYSMTLDGQRWDTPAMLVAVGNGPSYGGGMRVCPDARMDDGLLDVLVVEPISRLEFVRIFPRVYKGTHVSHPRVVVRRGRTLTIDAPGIVGYADGERLGPLPLACETVPGAIRVLAPAVGGGGPR